jgi:gp16 family phage-associated protein
MRSTQKLPLPAGAKAPLKTPEQVRAEFDAAGISFAEWARAHKVSRALVWKVLSSPTRNKRGESHRIAVLLGLKSGELGVHPTDLVAPSIKRVMR